MIQSLKKNWLLVPKMTWGIWWILMQAVASLKICTLMCNFFWKYNMFQQLCLSQKSTEELCVLTLRNKTKFEEEPTCVLKNYMKNLANFWPNTRCELKNYKGVMCTDIEGWCNILKKKNLTGGLKNDIRNLVNFHVNSRKSENLHFEGLFLSRSFRWKNTEDLWHWKMIQGKANSWEIRFFVWCNRLETVEGTLEL